MTNNERVRNYFQKSISDFDLIYTDEKSALGRFLDKRFRRDNIERYELTFEECSDIRGKKILDVGCGSGRYCIELAKAHPEKILGLDISENALRIASQFAKSNGLSDVCSFVCADFECYKFDTQFAIILAIGILDYIADPVSLISKMREITTEKIIMTFPSKSTYRMLIRKIRYWLKGCPLFFYDAERIKNILTKAGISDYTIRKLSGCDNSGDYFVVAKL